jgi:acyl-CoA synthetase (AMP-forming)/AMP-acid ligase II
MTWGGGHSINPALLEEFERRVGGVFVQGYARTEGGLAYNSIEPHERSFDHHGFANANSAEIAIFDPENGQLCPAGVQGEIAVRGDGVSPGYWDGNVTRKLPLYEGGWQPTGDLGELAEDGALRFLGRIDSMIKTGGENVYPAEVEQVLLKIEGVQDAVVFGLPDPRWGEKVAAVVVRSNPLLTAAAVEHGARASLGAFKIPRVVVFVPELPKLGNSKIDLQACRRLVETQQASNEGGTGCEG